MKIRDIVIEKLDNDKRRKKIKSDTMTPKSEQNINPNRRNVEPNIPFSNV